jgi:replication factor A1
MKITELKPKLGGVTLEFDVIEKGDVREFNKFGKSGRVCTAIAKDESGQVKLTLWNDDVDKVNVGDKVKLTEGYVNEYQGEMQLTTGRSGKLEIIGKADGGKESDTAKPSKKTKQADEESDGSDDESSVEDIDEEFVE